MAGDVLGILIDEPGGWTRPGKEHGDLNRVGELPGMAAGGGVGGRVFGDGGV